MLPGLNAETIRRLWRAGVCILRGRCGLRATYPTPRVQLSRGDRTCRKVEEAVLRTEAVVRLSSGSTAASAQHIISGGKGGVPLDDGLALYRRRRQTS